MMMAVSVVMTVIMTVTLSVAVRVARFIRDVGVIVTRQNAPSRRLTLRYFVTSARSGQDLFDLGQQHLLSKWLS